MDQVEVQGQSAEVLRDYSFHSALEAEEAEAEHHRTAASSKTDAEKKEERRQARATKTPEQLRADEVKAAKIRATQQSATAALIADLRAEVGPSLISTAAEIRFKEKQKKAAREAEQITKKGAEER